MFGAGSSWHPNTETKSGDHEETKTSRFGTITGADYTERTRVVCLLTNGGLISVGRLFAASVGGTSRQTSGESLFRLRTKVMKNILAPQTESQNNGTKYTAEPGAEVAPMLDGQVS